MHMADLPNNTIIIHKSCKDNKTFHSFKIWLLFRQLSGNTASKQYKMTWQNNNHSARISEKARLQKYLFVPTVSNL